jgi:SNF2 family DNA or RNA helicase
MHALTCTLTCKRSLLLVCTGKENKVPGSFPGAPSPLVVAASPLVLRKSPLIVEDVSLLHGNGRNVSILSTRSGPADPNLITDLEKDEYYKAMDINRLKSEAIDSVSLKTPTNLLCTLKPHQVGGVKRLMKMEIDHCGGILADDQGLGKTIEMIALMLCNPGQNLRRRLQGKPTKAGEPHQPNLIIW